MFILYFFLAPIVYVIIKLLLYLIVYKHGKFSYDGFSAAGFAYSNEKEVFYSTRNAWQKKFGYCHMYDVASPIFRMVIDAEPVRFFYNNKNWLLEFWKGQYGIVTGGEIGLYYSNELAVNKKTIYFPATDKDMLDMSFTLYKKGVEITHVKAKHWWLAIFKIGLFSKPKDLTMDITIRFPRKEMLEAFLVSFKKLGYKDKDFKVLDKTFNFTFKKPKTRKVWTRIWFLDLIRQHYNKKNVNLYNKYLKDVIDTKSKDKKLIRINNMIPKMLKNTHEEVLQLEHKPSTNYILLNDNVYSDLKRKP